MESWTLALVTRLTLGLPPVYFLLESDCIVQEAGLVTFKKDGISVGRIVISQKDTKEKFRSGRLCPVAALNNHGSAMRML